MTSADLVATATIEIDAPKSKVWEALVDPDQIEGYMFGTHVVADWETGGEITWQGEWEGKEYRDKGTILEITPEQRLRYTHYSPLSGDPDTPDSYHMVTVDLTGGDPVTTITLRQDNNDSKQARDHSQGNWQMMLQSLKDYLERGV